MLLGAHSKSGYLVKRYVAPKHKTFFGLVDSLLKQGVRLPALLLLCNSSVHDVAGSTTICV